jgi:hypothetical protein
MNLIPTRIGKNNPAGDNTVVFKCGDAHFRQEAEENDDEETDGVRDWFDPEFPESESLPGPNRQCYNTMSFFYTTNHPPGKTRPGSRPASGPTGVVNICPDGLKYFPNNIIGDDWKTRNWNGQTIQSIVVYRSRMMLHEMIHAVNPVWCKRSPTTSYLNSIKVNTDSK